ncbi:MAG: AAA family ATPase, partial [Bacteroidales bacterium]|nr:AAA family ATPase [Bacteroidales bacterium]
MKNLPIGIQSFEKLRKNGDLYVDKTEKIYQLAIQSKPFFLSRPRRFGKSLLISTLDALFSGRKELFEGLYVYDKWDWSRKFPVIRIDWTMISHTTPEVMEISLSSWFRRLARDNGITLFSEYAPDCFGELIMELHRKTGEKVVVLVDE